MMDLLYPYCKMFVDDGCKLNPYQYDWVGDAVPVVAFNLRKGIQYIFFIIECELNGEWISTFNL